MSCSTSAKILLAAIFALASCNNDKAVGVEYRYVDTAQGIIAGVDTWPAKIFVFRNDKCISIQDAKNIGSLTELKAQSGDKISTVAFENLDNLDISPLETGGKPETYAIGVINETAGTGASVWVGNSTINSSKTISQSLSPLTSAIALNVEGSSAIEADASLTIEGLSGKWNPATESFFQGDDAVSATVKSGKEIIVLPMHNQDAEWTPDIKISIDNQTLSPRLTLPQGIGKGERAEFSLDFSNYKKSNSYTVSCHISDIATGKAILSKSKTFISGEEAGRHYSVLVENNGTWEEMTVRDALCSNAAKHTEIWNDWNNSKAKRDTMSFCIFENPFTGPVKLRVKKLDGRFSSAQIRPSKYGISATTLEGNMIEFTIPSYDMHKISVEFDGDRQHNLFLYGYRPDANKPSASSSSVKYYGPGEHDAGTIALNSGQTLYIDYGAIVYGNVVANGSNVTIAGHGILSGAKLKHWGDAQYSWGDMLIRCNSSNSPVSALKISDITMIDSPGWNLCVTSTDGVSIKGVNMISWELNGDGIDIVSCTGVDISDCFIRTYDDCITLKCRFIVTPITDVSDVSIYDNLVWPDYARGVVVGPEAGNISLYPGRLHDIIVSDCTFLQHARGLSDDLRAAFAIGQGSDGSSDLWSGSNPPARISDITAENLTFDDIDPSGRAVSIRQYGGTPKVVMDNINFRNITVTSKKAGNYPALTIYTKGSTITGMKITGFTVNGEKIKGTGSQFTIDNPANVEYSIE